MEVSLQSARRGEHWTYSIILFQDKMQDSFMNTGDFFLESGVERIEPFHVPPRIYSLLNTVGWSIVTLIPMFYYLVGLLLSGKLLYFSIGCAFFGACKYEFLICFLFCLARHTQHVPVPSICLRMLEAVSERVGNIR